MAEREINFAELDKQLRKDNLERENQARADAETSMAEGDRVIEADPELKQKIGLHDAEKKLGSLLAGETSAEGFAPQFLKDTKNLNKAELYQLITAKEDIVDTELSVLDIENGSADSEKTQNRKEELNKQKEQLRAIKAGLSM